MSLNPTKLLLGLAGPFIMAGSGWLCSAVGKYGVHLDRSGVNALAVAGASAGAALVVKLIHDVEKKNPKLVADLGLAEQRLSQVASAATTVDPQLAVAAKQAESAVVSKVEAVDQSAAEALAGAWPAEPVVQPAAPVPAAGGGVPAT